MSNGNQKHTMVRQLTAYVDGFSHRLLPVGSAASICDLSAVDSTGETINFSRYLHKVILVVNIATGDADAARQCLQLNELAREFDSRGLLILAFPCNQFGYTEPFEGDEVVEILRHVRPGRGFDPLFKVFNKVEVNGQHTHPLYEYLKQKCPFPNDDITNLMRLNSSVTWSPVMRSDIGWSFEKFLINCYGQPTRRYSHRVLPSSLHKEIDEMVKKIPKAIREYNIMHRLDHRPATTSFISGSG